MRCVGEIKQCGIDYKTNKPYVMITLEDRELLKNIEVLKRIKKLHVELKKYSPKRTLNANAYMWVLLGKIAEVNGISNEEAYRNLIREAGVYEVVPLKKNAVQRFISNWREKGKGWICETTESKIEGYTNVHVYYGSSVYTKSEMARLINVLVQDCKSLNIETDPKEKIERLINKWGEDDG